MEMLGIRWERLCKILILNRGILMVLLYFFFFFGSKNFYSLAGFPQTILMQNILSCFLHMSLRILTKRWVLLWDRTWMIPITSCGLMNLWFLPPPRPHLQDLGVPTRPNSGYRNVCWIWKWNADRRGSFLCLNASLLLVFSSTLISSFGTLISNSN